MAVGDSLNNFTYAEVLPTALRVHPTYSKVIKQMRPTNTPKCAGSNLSVSFSPLLGCVVPCLPQLVNLQGVEEAYSMASEDKLQKSKSQLQNKGDDNSLLAGHCHPCIPSLSFHKVHSQSH